jgi:hypothetical protein
MNKTETFVHFTYLATLQGLERLEVAGDNVVFYGPEAGRKQVGATLRCLGCAYKWEASYPQDASGLMCPKCANLGGYPLTHFEKLPGWEPACTDEEQAISTGDWMLGVATKHQMMQRVDALAVQLDILTDKVARLEGIISGSNGKAH